MLTKLNSSTKSIKVWKIIQKISGKNQFTPLKHLPKNNTKISYQYKRYCWYTGCVTSTNSSSKNANKQFLKMERKLNFKSENAESYNRFFTITRAKRSHPKIPQDCRRPWWNSLQISQTTTSEIIRLLTLNNIWKSSWFPESWKLATIIPFPKPGKNRLYPSNYHPIALTSCLCKIMEWYGQQKAGLVHWIQQTYQLAMWLQEPCGQVGNLHKRGKHPKATPSSNILWSRESIWDHLEMWYHEGPTQHGIERQTAKLYKSFYFG